MLFDVLSMLSLVAAVGVEFHPLFMKKNLKPADF